MYGNSVEGDRQDHFARVLGRSSVGYAYAIFQFGRPVAVGGHGYARAPSSDRDVRARMTADTRIQIASVSKPITVVALLHELERQSISVDTTMVSILSHVFDAASESAHAVTLRQLINHTSGYEFGYVGSPRLENTRALLLDEVPNVPDETYRYSNINTSLIRTVLETLSGLELPTDARAPGLLARRQTF